MFILSLLPIILMSVLSYHIVSDKLISAEKTNLKQSAVTNSQGLDALLKSRLTEAYLLSQESRIYDYALSAKDSSKTSAVKSNDVLYHNAIDLLANCSKTLPHYQNIKVFDVNNNVILSTDGDEIGTKISDNLTLTYMRATASSANAISGVLKKKQPDGSYHNFIEIGYPIKERNSKKNILGYLVGTLDLSSLDTYLMSMTSGGNGYAFCLDKYGNYIFHPNSRYIGTNIKDDRLGRLVADYYSGKTDEAGSFQYTFDSANTIYGYSILKDNGWAIIMKQDSNAVTGLARIILYIFLAGIVFCSFVMLVASDKVATFYTEPIMELKNTLRTASEGNLKAQSNIRSKNEFGELSRNLNKMLHIVRNSYNELSAMHEELITKEEQLRQNYNHIEYLAYHDVLTNLPNKMAFIERVNQAIASSPGSNKLHAVYFVDLDDFKTVNDTLGHECGDNLLSQTATHLLSLTTYDDILARAGGDEFLLFRENLESEQEALDFAATIIESLKTPFHINGEAIYVSMSIGIALYPLNGLTHNSLIKNADIAMYKSKDTGKNKYTLFDVTMEEELNRNSLITEVLRHAIANSEIYVVYQPQYNIRKEKLSGFEALMRINNPKLGELNPDEFIPIAEESGMITELGEWVLRESCRFNKNLIDHGFDTLTVSVNISSVQLSKANFIEIIENILEETDLPARNLELEVTESTLVSSLTNASVQLSSLQELGIMISLDDFGTGYSSLNYLTNMPINTLKIDKSFINNICSNDKDARIASGIINLAHSMKLEVIAEGVEKSEQLEVLRKHKCDMIQGYIYSKPLLPHAFFDILIPDPFKEDCNALTAASKMPQKSSYDDRKTANSS
ncbi:diguanylate cyclase (GGDEF) domain-containing protein [Anaerocolumna xylanovorans DSM 12503]|uniref:Diguanylate cyclase (GGDEF) domain-containing protein n=1 Tax=Anaerocolumna xylanovorans DSM 12503 TaxID=1121345 RepID=A0A1M7YDE3_9FIRM|nr:diguanylate cyclase (GGDEF) domain-containing protein [Anaerocolumna xylanovorans DSM 12503]